MPAKTHKGDTFNVALKASCAQFSFPDRRLKAALALLISAGMQEGETDPRVLAEMAVLGVSSDPSILQRVSE
jgi:hypothetical protein